MVFVLTVWVLMSKRPQRQPARDPMLWITVIMFAMATLVSTRMYNQSQNFGVTQSFSSCADIVTFQHIGINYTRIIKAFIILRDRPGGPAAFYNELSEFTQIFGSAVTVAQTLIGDGVAVRDLSLMFWAGRRLVSNISFRL